MWKVELKFGPLAVWRTHERRVALLVVRVLKEHLLRLALSKRLPEPAKNWARAKLDEIEQLIRWEGESGLTADTRVREVRLEHD